MSLESDINNLSEEEFKECLRSPEPCRAVLSKIYGEDATEDIEKFGVERWDIAWGFISERAVGLIDLNRPLFPVTNRGRGGLA